MLIENDMYLEERRNRIVEYINQKGKVTTKQLGEVFQASTVTIRNDINKLDEHGLIVKVHGGALACSSFTNYEIPASSKYQKNLKIKQKMGIIGASFIKDNDIVFFDSGSSILEVAKALTGRNITAITNDLKTAMFLSENKNVHLIVVGGKKVPNLFTLVGTQTLKELEMYHADKVFLGCDAFDFEIGVTNRTLDEIDLKRAMIKCSKEVIAVADFSKHDKTVFASVCGVNEIDYLIADSISDENYIKANSLGLQVITEKRRNFK